MHELHRLPDDKAAAYARGLEALVRVFVAAIRRR